MRSVKTISEKQTEQLGFKIGEKLRGGEVIVLLSDLGGGKTALARGIASGAGSTDTVSSPSFTLSNVYSAGDYQIHHYDFYRLIDPGLLSEELREVLLDPKAVVIVEWPQIIENVLPKDRSIFIEISRDSTGEDIRNFAFTLPTEMDYVVEDLSV